MGKQSRVIILNGLSLVNALWGRGAKFFPFPPSPTFVSKATEHLLREGISSAHLSDDRLGRVLDRLYYKVGLVRITALPHSAMLQAYLSLKKLNDPTRFKSWLYGIVLNICRNDLRRRKVICFSLEAMVGNLVDEPPPIARSSPDPQLVAEQEELHTALLEAVNTLSPKNRSVILLFYFE